MKMETVDDLRKELKTILNIYLNAKVFFLDTEYLYNPNTDEERDVINRNLFLRRTRISAWRSSVLELCKLFQENKNEHYNLIGFLEKLKINHSDSEWKKKMPLDKIINFLENINNPKLSSIRKKLKILRDEEIAHTDRNSKQIVITFSDIKILLRLSEKIIIELKKYYLDTTLELELPESEKAGDILNIIYQYEKSRSEKIKEAFVQLSAKIPPKFKS